MGNIKNIGIRHHFKEHGVSVFSLCTGRYDGLLMKTCLPGKQIITGHNKEMSGKSGNE